jgi:polyhydroxybutyrate depolymerase
MVNVTQKWPFLKVWVMAFLTYILTACGPAITPQDIFGQANLPPTAASVECAPGSHTNGIISGGEPRRYLLYIPASYQPEKPAALVFGFHGNNGRAEHLEAYSGFSPLADREGFIVAYPQGSGEHPTWEAWQGSKDVQFVYDLIDRIATICSVDPHRIYATGHSLGGGMANRLACDLSKRIAAIGPVAGAYQDDEHCSPSRPVPVLAVHGTQDSVIFYNGFGGEQGMPPGAYFTVGTPIPQWASTWAKRNGCSATASIVFEKDPVSGQHWGECRSGADVVLYTIHGGEHGWPTPTTDFDAAQVIWDFFIKHPLVPAAGG